MFSRLGQNVSRYTIPWIAFWVCAAAAAILVAPPFERVWKDGEFAFLPSDVPSRRAEDLFRRAFPSGTEGRFQADGQGERSFGTSVQRDPLGSNVVIVLEREDRRTGLTPDDEDFISQVLLPALDRIRATTPRAYDTETREFNEPLPAPERIIRDISSREDRRIGTLLTSEDEKATLISIELETEFLDRQNGYVVRRVERLLEDPKIQSEKPLGLSMALSGSATVGRDMLRAEKVSAARTENITTLLVIVLLMLIYRAPLLALVPLVTVGVAVQLSQALLRIMASYGWIEIFTGLEVYVTVVVYGAGVDYCLFLIARYKEELDSGISHREAMSRSIHRVGVALATSAGTSIVGIAMMGFSDFGKFRQAGFAISFGLFVVVCFAVTFTPAFLLVFGKWAFWPNLRDREIGRKAGWLPSPSLWRRLNEMRWLEQVWEILAAGLQRYPGLIFLATALAMMPFAAVGVTYRSDLSYGLLTDLPQNEPSVIGAKVVQQHYAAGMTGPVTLLIQFDPQSLNRHFNGNDLTDIRAAERLSETIAKSLMESDVGSMIQDLRNQQFPLGNGKRAQEYVKGLGIAGLGAKRRFAHKTYTCLQGELAGVVSRMDLVLKLDPFSRESIMLLGSLERAVRQSIPAPLREGATILPLGTTAGIRDLKTVTDHDRLVIYVLVVLSVYLVIVMLLGRPRICAYLMFTVAFSYLVSLGFTYVVFYLRDPSGFTGIDWKVPIYLFTILIAMGEDYNILLMARIDEEQQTHGLVGGVVQALTKTGSIISSCGIIMAGTFCALMSGELLGMVQLGFALAFGVLLDTFVVRPILVPAYLILLYNGRFGPLGPWLGGPQTLSAGEPDPATPS